MGCAMVASTMAADAPGYNVVTDTCGGTMSGYCAIGMTNSESSPAIVATMAMTVASRGRSMKIAENIAPSALARWRWRRSGEDGCPGTQAFHTLHNHLLAALEALLHDCVGSRLAT